MPHTSKIPTSANHSPSVSPRKSRPIGFTLLPSHDSTTGRNASSSSNSTGPPTVTANYTMPSKKKTGMLRGYDQSEGGEVEEIPEREEEEEEEEELYDINNHSPIRSPRFYRETVEGVQLLYSRTGTEREREEIFKFVRERYDGSSTFENPVVLAKGTQAIVDIFCLTDLVPGSIWSELGEVFENVAYDGGRTIHMTQTLHLTLFPSLNPDSIPIHSTQHPSHPLYTSAPSTPFASSNGKPGQGSFAFNPLTTLTSIYTTSVPNHNHHKSQWPLFTLLSSLKPLTILSSLTTFHLKLQTKLILNEQGRIVSHEDTWGIKETLEGFVPLLSYIYSLNRNALGFTATLISRSIFRRGNNSTSLLAASPTSSNSNRRNNPLSPEIQEANLRESRLEEIRRTTSTSAFSLFGYGEALSPMQSRKNSIGSLNAVGMLGFTSTNSSAANIATALTGAGSSGSTSGGGGGTGGGRRPLLTPLEIVAPKGLNLKDGTSTIKNRGEGGGVAECDTTNDE